MQLNDYLKKESQSQREFGSTLLPPASQALVSQWIQGVTRVTLSYALQIERKTNGEVTPQDCADMYKEAASSSPTSLRHQPA